MSRNLAASIRARLKHRADSTTQDFNLTLTHYGLERLLYRLFHERGVRIFEPQAVLDRCSCSRDKIKGVLSGFTAEEITASEEDGEISVTCEFCSTTYRYAPSEFTPAADRTVADQHSHQPRWHISGALGGARRVVSDCNSAVMAL